MQKFDPALKPFISFSYAKESKGIYKAQFDPETGALSQLELVAAEPNPAYIAFFLKEATSTVSELKRGKEESPSFTADFQPLNHVVEEEHHFCYLCR